MCALQALHVAASADFLHHCLALAIDELMVSVAFNFVSLSC